MEDKNYLDIEVEHLCSICQFTHKCIRFKGVTEAIQKVEENALDKWRIDAEITYAIKTCDLFKIDEDKTSKMIDDIMREIEEEEDDSYFNGRNRLKDYDKGEEF